MIDATDNMTSEHEHLFRCSTKKLRETFFFSKIFFNLLCKFCSSFIQYSRWLINRWEEQLQEAGKLFFFLFCSIKKFSFVKSEWEMKNYEHAPAQYGWIYLLLKFFTFPCFLSVCRSNVNTTVVTIHKGLKIIKTFLF
jgi:hypothetical protein